MLIVSRSQQLAARKNKEKFTFYPIKLRIEMVRMDEFYIIRKEFFSFFFSFIARRNSRNICHIFLTFIFYFGWEVEIFSPPLYQSKEMNIDTFFELLPVAIL